MQPVALNRSILTGDPLSTPTPPHVQPAYYGALVVAEAIGTTGTTKIVEIPIADARVAGYAIYEGPALVRAVFLNSQSWPSGSTGARPQVQVSTLFLAAHGAPTKATMKRLKIAHSDDTAGVSWGCSLG